jgi:acetolactate synthase-1/2/3 large subunit
VFGVVGSGNFHVTNALIAGGARFVAARHECGAAVMADAWARTTGRVGMVSVHQGPGLTNAMTGIAEAAKSRTPLIVLTPEAPNPGSNFYVDVAGLARAVGAEHIRLSDPRTTIATVCRAYQAAQRRRTVVLALPLDVQAAETTMDTVCAGPMIYPQQPSAEAVKALATLLGAAERPVFIAGRGARHARRELEQLAERADALLATSAVAKGLFRGNARNLDVSGGFASPVTAELIGGADVLVGWGCALNMWTTRHGSLIGPDTTVVQVDDDPGAIGAHRMVGLGVVGDVAATALAVSGVLGESPRLVKTQQDLITGPVFWRELPYEDDGDG